MRDSTDFSRSTHSRQRQAVAATRGRRRDQSRPAATVTSRPEYGGGFTGKLWKYPGKGGWHFVDVPDRLAPPVTHGWGRTPVHATVDGYGWNTSVWRGKDGRTLLAVPARARGTKRAGTTVRVRLRFVSL